MNNKKMIILAVIVILVITIVTLATMKKDSFRENDVTAFKETFITEQYVKCLKKNKYPIENPTEKQKSACEAYAKNKWDEVTTLNGVGE